MCHSTSEEASLSSDPLGVSPHPTSMRAPDVPAVDSAETSSSASAALKKYRKLTGGKIFKLAQLALKFRGEGMTYAEIAERTGRKTGDVAKALTVARERGWVTMASFSQIEDQVELFLKPKAVRNYNQLLDVMDDDGNPVHKDIATEVMHGTGVFKTHQVVKSDGGPHTAIALKVSVEMPPLPAGHAIQIRPGSIGGTPSIEAEVIEESQS